MSRPAITVRTWRFRWLLVMFLLTAFATVALAQSSPTIVRVEEDWELVVGEPDPATGAPQVSCVISPTCGVEWLHATLVLNAQSLPSYVAGGLQLQVWEGEEPESHRKFPNENIFAHTDETVTWTQSVELSEGTLTFEIINGSSTTWGNFGGQGYLKASFCSELGSLNAYDPAVSVENSGVSYAANRVKSLILQRTRVYTSTGQVIEDNTQRIVHLQD